jgi:hypothetical protein
MGRKGWGKGKGGGNELKLHIQKNIKKYAKSRVEFFVVLKVK